MASSAATREAQTTTGQRGNWSDTPWQTQIPAGSFRDPAGIVLDDNWGPTADHHAFGTTFISWLGLRGVDPRAQIMLARHARPGITIKYYQDFSLFDLSSEIRKLLPIKAEGQT